MLDEYACRSKIVEQLRNGTLIPTSSQFYRNASNMLECHPSERMTLTLQGCYDLCGSGWAWFPKKDVGTRLTGWFLPIILLVANLHLPPLGFMYSLLTLVHLLGDPIDSLTSILTKLEVGRRSVEIAHRAEGTPST